MKSKKSKKSRKSSKKSCVCKRTKVQQQFLPKSTLGRNPDGSIKQPTPVMIMGKMDKMGFKPGVTQIGPNGY